METIEHWHEQLGIDPDDLDVGLVRQPDLFYHVADAFAIAVSKRDEAKLHLEEIQAVHDKRLRQAAVNAETKITEGAIQNMLRDTPEVKAVEREYLAARLAADRWQALKEAFQQRSFMLRELVSLKIRQLETLGLENGDRRARSSLLDAADERVRAAPRERFRLRRS